MVPFPASPDPVLSINDGIRDITEVGYPFEVGCSPRASQISLLA